MSTYLIGDAFFRIVREPQYPEHLTVLAERQDLLDAAHPAGSGAVCRSLDPDFPYAVHAHYLSLPAAFGLFTPRALPVLDQPLTPRPACWRWDGLLPHHEIPGVWEEHHGFFDLPDRHHLEPLLASEYRELSVSPWFAPLQASPALPECQPRKRHQ